MNDSKAVNHPSHYEKGDGHIECIDLLALISKGYKDIYANEVGQSKYLYRMGSKAEADLTKEQKACQDVKKSIWYLKDFAARVVRVCKENSDKDFQMVVYYGNGKYYDPFEADLIAKEFTYDKPEAIKETIAQAIKLIYCFHSLSDVREAISLLEKVVKTMSEENFTFE